MIPETIQTNLEYREIMRGEDVDYFIETFSYPVNLERLTDYTSRIQFPKSRAILIRTTPHSQRITIHIMRDVDLQSSFANFEVDLEGRLLRIDKKEGYISLQIEP